MLHLEIKLLTSCHCSGHDVTVQRIPHYSFIDLHSEAQQICPCTKTESSSSVWNPKLLLAIFQLAKSMHGACMSPCMITLAECTRLHLKTRIIVLTRCFLRWHVLLSHKQTLDSKQSLLHSLRPPHPSTAPPQANLC